jgi:hypothetical protein
MFIQRNCFVKCKITEIIHIEPYYPILFHSVLSKFIDDLREHERFTASSYSGNDLDERLPYERPYLAQICFSLHDLMHVIRMIVSDNNSYL